MIAINITVDRKAQPAILIRSSKAHSIVCKKSNIYAIYLSQGCISNAFRMASKKYKVIDIPAKRTNRIDVYEAIVNNVQTSCEICSIY